VGEFAGRREFTRALRDGLVARALASCLLAGALGVSSSPPAAAADADAGVWLRWLGVAGFSFEADGVVLLHDPYLSRPGLWRTLTRRYRPDGGVLEPLFGAESPAPELARARLVLVGHSHFDHLGDVAWIAQRTGARVAGSVTTVNVALGYGAAPADTRVLAPGDRLREGPFSVQALASRHATVLFGRVPFPGELALPPEAPLHAFSFPMGGALAYLVTHEPSGARIFVLSSAAVDAQALAGLAAASAPVDLLLAALAGRDAEFARTLVETLRPRRVLVHHHDDFFLPLDDPGAGSPANRGDLAAFEAEIAAAAAAAGIEAQLVRLRLFERMQVSPWRAPGT
jgi:L-ascorbate metabolism protein UlaG (beta-lactamase superfamily)